MTSSFYATYSRLGRGVPRDVFVIVSLPDWQPSVEKSWMSKVRFGWKPTYSPVWSSTIIMNIDEWPLWTLPPHRRYHCYKGCLSPFSSRFGCRVSSSRHLRKFILVVVLLIFVYVKLYLGYNPVYVSLESKSSLVMIPFIRRYRRSHVPVLLALIRS